ncbi:hypothetical protein C8Q77DRAFT_325978 [Trametes polyzona]|nr:hypothetical protein C8Q77DRAFT_325978 [Trametes polyzona]
MSRSDHELAPVDTTLSGASPLRKAHIQSSQHSAKNPDLDVKRRELRSSMHRKLLVVSHKDFIERFVPAVTEKPTGDFSRILKGVPVKTGKEVDMYEPFIKAMDDNNICPGYKFVATHKRGDPSDTSNEAVDIGLYPSGSKPLSEEDRTGRILSPPTIWSTVELCVECKADKQLDPFDEDEPDCEPITADRKKVLGQLLSYAELMFKRQQRTCIFMVLLLGSMCRILRFDHSGVVATKTFNYKTRGNLLADFLWRYSRWDADQRGHDTSAELVPHNSILGEAMKARAARGADPSAPGDYVRRHFAHSLRDDWSWWKLRVDDPQGGPRYFLVGKPNFQAPGVAGRGTRGYIALDANNLAGPFYYLKDAWRVIGVGIDKEGIVLKQLNEWHNPEAPGQTGVPYIPTLECHGDVRCTLVTDTAAEKAKSKATVAPAQGEGEDEDDTSVWQLTQTQFVWEDMPRKSDEPNARSPYKKHKHYRIVVREVGLPMAEFKDSYQLVYALSCCIHAHSMAYRAGVIHRDISAGNVLLYYNPREEMWFGLLNDWELSKQIKSPIVGGRQLDRTGTWQFMSAHALDKDTKEIDIQDELESFFHVLLYFAIRFLPHNCVRVTEFMTNYFDSYTDYSAGGLMCGELKRSCMLNGRIHLGLDPDAPSRHLQFFMSASPDTQQTAAASKATHPLNNIIRTLLKWFCAYYTINNKEDALWQPTTATEASPSQLNAGAGPRKKVLLVPGGTGVREESVAGSAQWFKEQEELAENLATHGPIVTVLNSYLAQDALWPDDKIADQMGKKKDSRANVPTAQMKKGGSMPQNAASSARSVKRKTGEMDAPAQQGRPKRSKSSQTLQTSTRQTRSMSRQASQGTSQTSRGASRTTRQTGSQTSRQASQTSRSSRRRK